MLCETFTLLAGGWDSTWKWPLVAVVVIISVLIAFLVFVMNVSLKQQGWLLYEMVRTNKELAMTTRHLEDEKVGACARQRRCRSGGRGVLKGMIGVGLEVWAHE